MTPRHGGPIGPFRDQGALFKKISPWTPTKIFIIIDFLVNHPVYYYVNVSGLN